MTRVSSKKLKKSDFDRLYRALLASIAKLDTRHSQKFFDELLTDTERVMLTKRYSAIIMFNKGYSAYRVSKALMMSHSTAGRIRAKYEFGEFTHMHTLCTNRRHKKEYDAFWDLLDEILRAGLPPRGKGRWQFLNELE